LGTSRTQLTASLHATRDAALARALPDGRNLVVVPLSAGKRALGVLVLEHPMRAGSRIERRVVSMLERLAAHAALALRNAWLLEEIQHLAATDALTGLANRATFQITLGQELARARRAGGDVSLVLLDIDHFKALNDTHGHLAGDEVLRGVSAALDECCRAFDTPARYGGEEFAVVLPQTDAEEALAVAERLREAIAGARVEPGVTVSVGVATFPLHGDDPDDLVKAADDALYASKRAGRDRVTSAA
jgi:two-component system cell cycle response regulator